MAIFKKVKLEDALEALIDYRGKTPKKTLYGIPLVTAKIVKGGFIGEPKEFIAESDYKSWMTRGFPQVGDVVLTTEAPLGEVAQIKNSKIALAQRIVTLRGKQGVLSSDYLKFFLKSPIGQSRLKERGTGTTVLGIKQSELRQVEIDLPDFPTQSHIGSLLSNYDNLIENNEKRIKALEEMAQLLYTEWFVKFKFPGHEKAKMVDSDTEYGMIPEGWEVKRLDEVIRIVRGRSYSSEQISDTEGEYYIVNLKSFNRGGGFRTDGDKYYSGQVSNDQLLKQGDIVVAVTDMTNDRAVIARPARIPEITTHKTTLSADVVKIATDKIPSSFIYYCLLDHRFTEATKHKANGANVLHLKPTAIGEYRALIPSIQLLYAFDALCKPSFDLIDKIIQKNYNLQKMRDLLIPQLVTGKRILK